MSQHRSRFFRICLMVVLLGLVSACSGSTSVTTEADGSPSPTGDSSETSTTTEGSSTTSADGAGEEYDASAVFQYAWSVSPQTLDPDRISAGALEAFAYPIFDTLVHINAATELEPMLAQGWTLSEDGSTLTMELIEGWSFHDGTPFNAEAVQANLERSMTLPDSTNGGALESIAAVNAVDEYTVEIELDGAAPPLLAALGTRAGMMISPAVFDSDELASTGVGGSGAYRVTEVIPGDRVVYEAVEDYWDPENLKLAGLVIGNLGDDVGRMNAVLDGDYHATHLRPNQIAEADDGGLVVVEDFPIRTYNLYLNTARSELDDVRVRQAINHAIDRQAIDEGLNDGFCDPIGQPLPPGHWAHNSEVPAEPYPYDPERASELLAEAGLEGGFSLDVVVLNLDLYVSIAEAIQAQLAEVGIEMSIQPLEFAEAQDQFLIAKERDGWVMASQALTDVGVLTGEFYVPEGNWNPGAFQDDQLTQLHVAGLASVEQDERAPVYHELFARAAELAAPIVHICTPTAPSEAHEVGWHNVEAWRSGVRQFRNIWFEG